MSDDHASTHARVERELQEMRERLDDAERQIAHLRGSEFRWGQNREIIDRVRDALRTATYSSERLSRVDDMEDRIAALEQDCLGAALAHVQEQRRKDGR